MTFSAEPATKAVNMQQTVKDDSHVQKNEEEIAADSAKEPKPSDWDQKDNEKQKDVDQLLTSDQSESLKQPSDASEEPEALTETETDNIVSGV